MQEASSASPQFRVVVFSSLPAARLRHVLWRLTTDLPEIKIAGVVYELRRPPLARLERIRRALGFLPDRAFRRFVLHRACRRLKKLAIAVLDRLLHALHACPRHPNGAPPTIDSLAREYLELGARFHVTNDLHAPESLAFVRGLQSNLGIVFGTGILQPTLFEIPSSGCVNIHQHKLPTYRGSGEPGLWELRDGCSEQTVTIHRIVAAVDAGPVLAERSFRIDPYDTLSSIGLKAQLVSIDLLVDVLRAETAGDRLELPQPNVAKLHKGLLPHALFTIARDIRKKRGPYLPRPARPLPKLVARCALLPLAAMRNRRHRRAKSYPVVVLFHHVITDKPKFMGLATEQFARQVRYLKKHYRIASLDRAVAMLEAREVDAPTVVLTFDDGYAENFLCARAVAEAEDVPVTYFICTQKVQAEDEFEHDWDRGEHGFRAMSWQQIAYLAKHGATIGSHTRTHFDCGGTDPLALSREIVGSRDELASQLGGVPSFFAFPYGYPKHISAVAERIARETYLYVFSAHGGVNRIGIKPPCVLYRASQPDTLLELELLMQSLLEIHPPNPERVEIASSNGEVDASSMFCPRDEGDAHPSRETTASTP